MTSSGSKSLSPPVDFGKTARDYKLYRPAPPASYYQLLSCFGIGRPGQTVLDLGTGPGFVACELARKGARVTGCDISHQQIEQAADSARELGIDVNFVVDEASDVVARASSIDVVIANMSWWFLRKEHLLDLLHTRLASNGVVVLSRFAPHYEDRMCVHVWDILRGFGVTPPDNLSRPGPGSHGFMINRPEYRLQTCIYSEELIAFTAESWAGRWRTHPRVLAQLEMDQLTHFSSILEQETRAIHPGSFMVNHFMDLEIYVLDRHAFAAQHESANRST